MLEQSEPVYDSMPGWKAKTVGILDEEKLPQRARDYVARIEAELDCPALMISTGPRREETIVRETELMEKLTSGRLATVLSQRG